MNIKLLIGFVFLAAFTLTARGQDHSPYSFKQADSLIQKLSEEADYIALSKKLEDHLAHIDQEGITDSLYKYVYILGRTETELKGTQAGIDRTEAFVDRIIEIDQNKSHQLSALSDLSWIYIEAGDDSMCFETDKRYLQIVESYPEASPREKYLAHYALGFDYELVGNTGDAINHFKQALEAVKSDSLKHITELMDGNNGLGAALWRKGDLEKAKKAFDKSIHYSTLYKDTLKGLMYQANALGNMSLVYEDQGNLVKSKELLEESLTKRKRAIAGLKDIYEKDQQTRHLIRNYHNLAALYLNLGDLERSRKMTALCEELRDENLPDGHPDRAKSFEAYGSIEFAQGNYKKALEYFQKSLEKFREAYGEYSTPCMTDHMRIGKACNALGHYDVALEHLSKAIKIARELSSEDSNQELANGYYLRSRTNRALGNFGEAENDLRSALRIFTNTRSPQNFMFGRLFVDMAYLKSDQDQTDSANYYIDKAIDLGSSVSVQDFSKFNAQLKYLPEAYGEKAILLSAKKDPESLSSALDFAMKGKELIKQVRMNYEEEISQIALYEDQADIFHVAIDIAYALYSETGDQGYIHTIHQLAEESKSIILRQQLNKFTSLRVKSVPDTLLNQEYALLAVISGKVPGSTPEEILNAEKEYNELLDIFKSQYPAYYQLRYEERTASIPDLQNQYLKDDENILEYVFTDQSGYGILINKGGVFIKKLDLEKAKSDLEKYNVLITARDESLKNASQNLYETLFDPFEENLSGNRVFVVPDNGIFNLNFETLWSGKNNRYLIHDYQISYLLSATTAFQYKQLNRDEGKGLLALAPGFTDEMKKEYVETVVDSAFLDQQYLSSIQQPFSIQTARQIAGLFSGKAYVTEEATEQNFKKLADEYSIIHLGTHTEINNLSPLLSRFILTKPLASENEQDDGYLHAYEIYNMPLRAELAVLTACETGIGKETSAEGVLSIAHSFAYAGCPSVVMSIWQIDEKTSAEIIELFYAFLKEGQSKNDALRNAKLKFIESHRDEELSHPYYWSGLVLVGNTEPVATGGSDSGILLWIIVFIAIGVTVFAAAQKKKRSENPS
jgi:CHAT domain-containing protein/Flp pilus assembly protein TadD